MADTLSTLRAAIAQKVEVFFTFNGVKVDLQPHVIYTAADGTVTIAGIMGRGIPVHVPVDQIKALTITGRAFQPDATFNLADPRYNNADTIIKLG